jgi:hypothetical protein
VSPLAAAPPEMVVIVSDDFQKRSEEPLIMAKGGCRILDVYEQEHLSLT